MQKSRPMKERRWWIQRRAGVGFSFGLAISGKDLRSHDRVRYSHATALMHVNSLNF